MKFIKAIVAAGVVAASTLPALALDISGAGATFPQIWIGETHVGGCDELYALDREGKLDAMLDGEKAAS